VTKKKSEVAPQRKEKRTVVPVIGDSKKSVRKEGVSTSTFRVRRGKQTLQKKGSRVVKDTDQE